MKKQITTLKALVVATLVIVSNISLSANASDPCCQMIDDSGLILTSTANSGVAVSSFESELANLKAADTVVLDAAPVLKDCNVTLALSTK